MGANLEQIIEQLRKNEERYHKMIAEVEDYAIIPLDRDGIIQNWNRGAERIKQYKESEIVGKHFSEFYPPDDIRDNLPNRLLAIARTEGRVAQDGWRKRKRRHQILGKHYHHGLARRRRCSDRLFKK